MEYFRFKGDGRWESADVVDGTVIRMPKAYPIYDAAYMQGASHDPWNTNAGFEYHEEQRVESGHRSVEDA